MACWSRPKSTPGPTGQHQGQHQTPPEPTQVSTHVHVDARAFQGEQIDVRVSQTYNRKVTDVDARACKSMYRPTPRPPRVGNSMPRPLRHVAYTCRPIPRAPGEGIRGGYASAKQNFPRKTGTAAVRDHGITTRRADAAEPSRCRRTRRG
jgi:hypothetical protein